MLEIINDALGTRRIGTLTVADCDAFLTQAASGLGNRKPIGPQHLRRLRSTLVAVLANAEREGRLSRNVAAHSLVPASPAKPPKQRRSLTTADLETLLTATQGTALGAAIVLCGVVGLRPAEARALLWRDICFETAAVEITKQMGSDARPTVPKTRRASRRLGVDDSVVSLLRQWRTTQSRERLAIGRVWADEDLVLTTAVGTAIDKDNFKRGLLAKMQSLGLKPISPYELRHTALTHMSRTGHTNSQIADYAGTSARMVEDTYRHRLDGTLRLASSGIPGAEGTTLGTG